MSGGFGGEREGAAVEGGRAPWMDPQDAPADIVFRPIAPLSALWPASVVRERGWFFCRVENVFFEMRAIWQAKLEASPWQAF